MSKKILVIEDNPEVRENIVEILSLDGYDVLAAENGKIGVEAALAQTPDLILCDIMMPVLDGFGVLKILNKNVATHHIPFVFLTAKAEKEDFRRGMGLGADDYITKPFDDTELLEAIEMRLAKSDRVRSISGSSDESLRRFFSEAKARRVWPTCRRTGKQEGLMPGRVFIWREAPLNGCIISLVVGSSATRPTNMERS